MRKRAVVVACAALALALATSSCSWFRGKPAAPVLVPPVPVPSKAPPADPLPPPPAVESSTAGSVPEIESPPIPVPKPPEAAKPAGAQTRPVPAPKVEPEPPEAPPAPLPKLTQLLTPEQRREIGAEIEEAVRSAQQDLARTAGRRLSRDQEINLQRARAFLQQALAARESDLITARSLAQRAALLAADIARSLQ